jgi:hypothetical protein
MRHFQQIAQGVDVMPLQLDLYRQPGLWNERPARTSPGGWFDGTDDIWLRFREPSELVSREAFAEPFTPVFYPAWHALPHVRPLVFDIMRRVEAVQLGGILITRVPAGGLVAPHDDRGRWHPEFFATKAYAPILTNDRCISTCGNERVVMRTGDVWLFNNLETHSTVNDGETDRVTLIVSMRVE